MQNTFTPLMAFKITICEMVKFCYAYILKTNNSDGIVEWLNFV